MPNWCFTDYRIYGNKTQRGTLLAELHVLNGLPKPRVENGFGNLWLGCIIDALGGDWHTVECRGQVLDFENYDDYLRISTESAWAECNEFRHFLEEKFPDLSVYHMSEELGCAGIWTNDMTGDVFEENWYLDSCLSEFDSDYFYSLEEVADYINDVAGENSVEATKESIDAFLEKYSEEHDDEYLTLYQIERIDD